MPPKILIHVKQLAATQMPNAAFIVAIFITRYVTNELMSHSLTRAGVMRSNVVMCAI